MNDCFAFDVFHNKIGKSIDGGATVKQPGNVWMFEVGENLTLHHEATQNCVGVHAPVDELDGHLLAVLLIGPHREKNGSHSAVTNFAKDLVGADTLSDTVVIATALNLIESRNHSCVHNRRRGEK